jgi:hypothetical protein
MTCPLCKSIETSERLFAQKKYFRHCKNCDLIFMELEYLISEVEDEKRRYLYHENTVESTGYVTFLSRAIDPSLKYFNCNFRGLDFGCGPNSVLSQLLINYGFACDYYDPIFFPEINSSIKYDFYFCNREFRAFYNPLIEIELITRILSKNGILTIMTELHKGLTRFCDWYYLKDDTHVCFYSLETFKYIQKVHGFKLLETDNHRVIILRKE